MLGKSSKRDIKSMVAVMKKFINGEDVAAEVLPESFNLAALNPDELKKLWIAQDHRDKGVLIRPGCQLTHGETTVTYDDLLAIGEKMKGRPRPRWFNEMKCDGTDNDARKPSWFMDNKPVDEETFNSELNAAKERGEFVWHEQRSYKNEPLKDPDFDGISYVHPETLKDIEDFKRSELKGRARLDDVPAVEVNPQPKKQAKIKPLMKPGSQQYLKQKLELFNKEQEAYAEQLEKRVELNQANNKLSNEIKRILS